MDYLHNNSGFTLINSLLRIAMLMLSLPILVTLLAKVSVNDSSESLQIQQLFYLIQQEINDAENMYTAQNRLYLKTRTNEIVSIELYGQTIRRRVDQSGHEIYARNILNVQFVELSYGIQMSVQTNKGETYETILIKL